MFKKILIIILSIILIISVVTGQIYPKFAYLTDSQNNGPVSHLETQSNFYENDQNADHLSNGIPLELIEKINNVENVSEFFDEFIDKKSVDPRDIVIPTGEKIERSAAVMAKPAGCMPDSAVVPLKPDTEYDDPTIIYFPSCTRVKRCSGCCSHALLSCQPVETETITFTVIKSQFVGGSKMEYRGKEIVLVDQHTKCKCDCKMKESDCNYLQRYEKSQCKCVCTNYEHQNKCLRQSGKIWDAENCTCRCREVKECTTGTFFDETQCQCSQTALSILDRKKFIIKPVPVAPVAAATRQ